MDQSRGPDPRLLQKPVSEIQISNFKFWVEIVAAIYDFKAVCLELSNVSRLTSMRREGGRNQVPKRKEDWKLIQHGTKRDATEDIQLLDKSTVKKMRDTKESCELNDESGKSNRGDLRTHELRVILKPLRNFHVFSLLRIEEEFGAAAVYAGSQFIALVEPY
ncbi:unnamed protein product [Lupinus luteus]|uniref:Uncharacterized protein n=1 Tax=Lupinus luteus TaxID=3873 RepID=A0AAV1X9X5_LUPLU